MLPAIICWCETLHAYLASVVGFAFGAAEFAAEVVAEVVAEFVAEVVAEPAADVDPVAVVAF